jgi:diaminopimelate decarboxylase
VTLYETESSLRCAVTPRTDRAIWPLTTTLDELGRLCIGDVPLREIADEFRTPTYVLDEADFRRRIRSYGAALPGVRTVYSGRSLLTTALAQWVTDEGLDLDVCSTAELATALAAGVNPSRIIMHGNAKISGALGKAAAIGVGRIVVDTAIESAFVASGVRGAQSVLVRVPPGIDIHSYRFLINEVSGQRSSFALGGGHTAGAVRRVLTQPPVCLVGLHCHIGSQVTDASLYGEAIHRMIPLMADVRVRHGVTMTELNIGGGPSVPHVPCDPDLDLGVLAKVIDDALDEACAMARFPHPTIVVDPGHSISARAGVTLYRVLSVRSRPGTRTLVTVDGDMTGKPAVTPSGPRHSVALANRHGIAATALMTVVGRHCETGYVMARDVQLPTDVDVGDLLAVACNSADHHIMGSTYDMVARPSLVAVKDGHIRELVRQETIADLLFRDRGCTERPK